MNCRSEMNVASCRSTENGRCHVLYSLQTNTVNLTHRRPTAATTWWWTWRYIAFCSRTCRYKSRRVILFKMSRRQTLLRRHITAWCNITH